MNSVGLPDVISTYRFADRLGRRDIDERLWATYGKDLTVVVIDMAGFTRTVTDSGLVAHLASIDVFRRISRVRIEAAGGRVVKFSADNVFAVFGSPELAVNAMQALGEAAAIAGIAFSAGIDHGLVLDLEDDIWGDAMNQASRLGEDLAKNGELLISRRAFAALTLLTQSSFKRVEYGTSEKPLIAFSQSIMKA